MLISVIEAVSLAQRLHFRSRKHEAKAGPDREDARRD
jgi:hypothetical protein